MNNFEDWFVAKVLDINSNKLGRFHHPCSKVICVGRNYREHAKELNNSIPQTPLLFIKPNSSAVDLERGFNIPQSDSSCHHELEVALLIGVKAQNIASEQVKAHIAGVGLGLDLTLRELQQQLKTNGEPWEKSKAFDGACPLSYFVPVEQNIDFANIEFELIKNDQVAQKGNTSDMIFNIEDLVAYISQIFTLYPGDIIMTGTPAGVAELKPGDQLNLTLNQHHWVSHVD